MRVAQALLATDGVVLLWYGVASLLLVPGATGEAYLSSGRLLYGILPTALGAASIGCALWIGIRRR